jgi:hypothetical protein
MSLNKLCGDRKDECGYTCIKPPSVDHANSVYEFASDNAMNMGIENSRLVVPVMFLPKKLSKARLTKLSIQSIN